MATLHNLSSSRLLKSLPYDAEVEYLESRGTPYIDTGLPATFDGIIAEIELYVFDNIDYDYSGTSTQFRLFYGGPRYDNGTSATTLTMYTALTYNASTQTHRFSLSLDGRSSTVINNFFDKKIKLIIDGINHRYSINGVSYSPTSLNWNTVKDGHLALFGREDSVINEAHCRIFSARFSDGGKVLRDFHPVRVNNEGFMYDKVTRKLFGNRRSTGLPFLVGPDV